MSISGHINSYYASSANSFPEHPKLTESVETDVCIVGAGYTGLSAALHLRKAGINVTILEAEKVSWGASGRNGGQVSVGQNRDHEWLVKKLGSEPARQLWENSIACVQLVKDLIKEHDIKCGWRSGLIHAAWKKSETAELKAEVDNLRNKFNYEHISFIESDDMQSMLGTKRYHAGQLDTFSGHLHPLNYALGLAQAATDAGAKIYENSRVLDYKKGETVEVRTSHGVVKAKHLVIACNGYIEKLEPKITGKIMPINNFILATEPLGDERAKQLIRDNVAVADTKFVVNYFRLSEDNRLLFGGGENYSPKFPKDIKQFVRKYMLEVFPQLSDVKIDYAWGGTLAITLNRMPHFQKLSSNIHIAQGYSGHGIALATMGGKAIAEAIAGNPETFDLFANVPTHTFPGGTLLRYPGLVAGMMYYSLLDKLP